jgi:hypothetical protein
MAATADLDGILAAFQKSKEDFAQMQELYQQVFFGLSLS